jgi:hypothetical protein
VRRPRLPALVSRLGSVPLSAADLKSRQGSFLGTITQLLAAVIALLWGASMILSGVFGIQPGSDIGNLVVVAGIILALLAVDQLWREIRRLS